VLIDVEGYAETGVQSPTPGLWRAFKSTGRRDRRSRPDELKPALAGQQGFLRGHSATIGLLEVGKRAYNDHAAHIRIMNDG
jgi:hypothetical protein